eukprot:3572388-Alexandrium_andersonii.AAC.1
MCIRDSAWAAPWAPPRGTVSWTGRPWSRWPTRTTAGAGRSIGASGAVAPAQTAQSAGSARVQT